MAKDVSRLEGQDGPVEGINPKDPPPEIIKGLAADRPYSARMSVPSSHVAVEAPEGDEDGR